MKNKINAAFKLAGIFCVLMLAYMFWAVATVTTYNGARSGDILERLSATVQGANLALFGDPKANKTGTLAKLDLAIKRFDTLAQELNATSNIARQVSIKERDEVLPAQNAALTQFMQKLGKVTDTLNADAQTAGESLKIVNEHTLPALDKGIEGLNTLTASLKGSTDRLPATIDAATTAINGLGALAADPSIKASLANINLASAELVKSGENVTATTGEIKTGVGYVVDSLKPSKKGFWGKAGNTGGKIAACFFAGHCTLF